MSISKIDSEAKFRALLNEYVSASAPIKSIEHLRGREEQSQRIERALGSKGRSVFIYGDRGVGKTSLAQTSAYRFNNSASEPRLISVDSSSTFFSIVHDLVSQIAGQRPDLISQSTKVGGKSKLGCLSIEVAKQIQTGSVPVPTSINEAVGLIEFFFPSDSTDSVVVIDEFERLQFNEDRSLFADFIKQIGDRELNLKFIFCGIAVSLDQLLASHHSCYRYMESVELERLDWNARAEIILAAADSFGIKIDDDLIWKISAISDGFPYYVHIVCEKLFWVMFDDEELVSECSEAMLELSVNEAVQGIEPTLKKIYESATRKYSADYQEVLWAAANNNNLERRNADMYGSYISLMSARPTPAMNKALFNNRLGALKKDTHGGILVGTRPGWYRFDENVIRGYVRLRAVQQGVVLDNPNISSNEIHEERLKKLNQIVSLRVTEPKDKS